MFKIHRITVSRFKLPVNLSAAQQVVGALQLDHEVAVGSGPMNYETSVHAREACKRRVIWVNL
jgi:hypothetical protein